MRKKELLAQDGALKRNGSRMRAVKWTTGGVGVRGERCVRYACDVATCQSPRESDDVRRAHSRATHRWTRQRMVHSTAARYGLISR